MTCNVQVGKYTRLWIVRFCSSVLQYPGRASGKGTNIAIEPEVRAGISCMESICRARPIPRSVMAGVRTTGVIDERIPTQPDRWKRPSDRSGSILRYVLSAYAIVFVAARSEEQTGSESNCLASFPFHSVPLMYLANILQCPSTTLNFEVDP